MINDNNIPSDGWLGALMELRGYCCNTNCLKRGKVTV